MNIDKRAQPMFGREIGSYYASTGIPPWSTGQLKITLNVITIIRCR